MSGRARVADNGKRLLLSGGKADVCGECCNPSCCGAETYSLNISGITTPIGECIDFGSSNFTRILTAPDFNGVYDLPRVETGGGSCVYSLEVPASVVIQQCITINVFHEPCDDCGESVFLGDIVFDRLLIQIQIIDATAILSLILKTPGDALYRFFTSVSQFNTQTMFHANDTSGGCDWNLINTVSFVGISGGVGTVENPLP